MLVIIGPGSLKNRLIDRNDGFSQQHEPTGHELSLLGEDLNAVAAALADVNQTVA
jgi:hypothetical protein